jgi:hypothetical protein
MQTFMPYNTTLGQVCIHPFTTRLYAFISVFQAHMTKIFYDFEDVIVYIHNIILFTKTTCHHHLKRLSLVLEHIQSQNLHVHVEETFLATNQVDYLGYTLTSKGIKPQKQKIMSILALA